MRSDDDDFLGLAQSFKLLFSLELNHVQDLIFGALCENAVIQSGSDKVPEHAFCRFNAFLFRPFRKTKAKIGKRDFSSSGKYEPGDGGKKIS